DSRAHQHQQPSQSHHRTTPSSNSLKPSDTRRTCSARCRISSRQVSCSARQFRSHSSPLNRGWPHQQKRCLQEQPVQPRSNSHRKDRDENQNRKFQRGDHDVPPNLRFKEWHAHDQTHHVVNKGLTARGSLSLCVDEYTLCRSARQNNEGNTLVEEEPD